MFNSGNCVRVSAAEDARPVPLHRAPYDAGQPLSFNRVVVFPCRSTEHSYVLHRDEQEHVGDRPAAAPQPVQQAEKAAVEEREEPAEDKHIFRPTRVNYHRPVTRVQLRHGL